jgi:hypothetical protein
LLDCGVTDEEITTFRDIMLEPADSPASSISRMESRTKDAPRDPGLFGDYWWANRFLSRSRFVEGFRGQTVDVVMLGDSIMHFGNGSILKAGQS